MYDLIIIGSGPAGITAGIYAKRANLKVLVFEKGAPGGQILNTAEIENYPGFKKTSGYELASSMFEHLLELGCEVVFNEVINITNNDTYKTVHTNNETYNAKAVLIAAGAVPRTLNVENEDLFTSNGISWCAICDGPSSDFLRSCGKIADKTEQSITRLDKTVKTAFAKSHFA